MNKIFLLFFFCFLFFRGQAADKLYCTDEDRAVFDRYLSEMTPVKSLPTGELMVKTARFFLDAPYVAATLEKEPEGLVINLREMDCMTLVENVVALTKTMQSATPCFVRTCKRSVIVTGKSMIIPTVCIIRQTGSLRTSEKE